MDATTLVEVFRCTPGSRQFASRVEVGWLMTCARGYLPAQQFEQFQNDMTVLGRARINTKGGWFEYTVGDAVADG